MGHSQSPVVKQKALGLVNIYLNCWEDLTEDHFVIVLFLQATLERLKESGGYKQRVQLITAVTGLGIQTSAWSSMKRKLLSPCELLL